MLAEDLDHLCTCFLIHLLVGDERHDEVAGIPPGCKGCHGFSGNLKLGDYTQVTTDEGIHGLAVIAGDAAASNLVLKLRTATNPFGTVMPQGNPDSVTDEDLATITAWIDGGAKETCP